MHDDPERFGLTLKPELPERDLAMAVGYVDRYGREEDTDLGYLLDAAGSAPAQLDGFEAIRYHLAACAFSLLPAVAQTE